MVFIWTAPDLLNRTAKTLSTYVTEIQDAVNVKRAEIALVPISFINQRVGKKFRLAAIEELKTEINDLAILFGYPTGVADPLLLNRPWVTMSKRFGKYLTSYPIINDMRLVLNALILVGASLIFAYILNSVDFPRDENIADLNITTGPLTIKNQFKPQLANTPSETSISIDDKFLFRCKFAGAFDARIYKDSPINGVNILNASISNFASRDITVDSNYCWLNGRTQDTWDQVIARVNKSTLAGASLTPLTNILNGQYFRKIINDKDYIYLMGTKYVSANPPHIYNTIMRLIIRKYSKLDLTSYTEYEFDASLIPENLNSDPNEIVAGDIAIDDTYLYVTYNEQRLSILMEPGDITGVSSCILRITKSSMSQSGTFDVFTESPQVSPYRVRFDGAGISASENNLYVVARKEQASADEYAVYTKAGVLQFSANILAGSSIGRDGDSLMACVHEYNVTLI